MSLYIKNVNLESMTNDKNYKHESKWAEILYSIWMYNYRTICLISTDDSVMLPDT